MVEIIKNPPISYQPYHADMPEEDQPTEAKDSPNTGLSCALPDPPYLAPQLAGLEAVPELDISSSHSST